MTELTKIRDISLKYDISSRALKYYEDMGLINSTRSDDYAYRMYDQEAVNRLEQILILRKLNIRIKDIQRIFNTPGSDVVLEVLGKKVDDIDEEVSLLHELKEIVQAFIRQIKKSDFSNESDVKMLYEKAKDIENQLVSVDYEGVSAQTFDLDDIAVRIRKLTNIRVVELPTKPIALYRKYEDLPDEIKRFNQSLYPSNFRRFNAPARDFQSFIVLPENYSADASMQIDEFKGGLYAVALMNGEGDWGIMANLGLLYRWINENDFVLREDVPMFRNDLPSQGNQPPLTEMYFPIAHVSEQTPAMITQPAGELLSKLKIKHSHKIDLNTLFCQEPAISYMKDGERIVYDRGHDGYLHTTEKFNFPIMVKMRARTDSTNIRLSYSKADIIFNWEMAVDHPFGSDINGKDIHLKGLYIPARYYADIVWVLDRTEMAIIVNDDVKFHRTGMDTSEANEVCEHVNIAAAWHSTVSISELEIFELE